ncbi:Mitochondrial import receptor subunit tom20 [Golovinomyces cichoracearum]|uniref:Mitochondrial import receptor subunit tom20 n=1 Tax=Golovinomyces cichoracearum TaxID=62708 RepID=A0A420HHH3_9PEZI|nr:Mitochondrial import receptor subunit tom20 [Golovinomyces cichoracearum]
MVKSSTIVTASLGTIVTGLLAYAAYFDYRRRNDPEFRRQIRRNTKKQAKALKEDAESQVARQRQAIQAAVETANREGYPTDGREMEAYFLEEVARGEGFGSTGTENFASALSFFKAMKVYPSPQELISVYDKSLPKAVLDILAEMIAADPSLNVGPFGAGSNAFRGLD